MPKSTKTHEGMIKGFHHQSRAWYGKKLLALDREECHVDEIMIGFYAPEGGTTGEFAVRWMDLGHEITP